MARKHLLSDLVPTKLSADNSPSETPPLPEQSAFGARGAIGAVSRSIEMLKSQSISEIDPDLIDAPDITDRLDESEEHFEEFAAQIKRTWATSAYFSATASTGRRAVPDRLWPSATARGESRRATG